MGDVVDVLVKSLECCCPNVCPKVLPKGVDEKKLCFENIKLLAELKYGNLAKKSLVADCDGCKEKIQIDDDDDNSGNEFEYSGVWKIDVDKKQFKLIGVNRLCRKCCEIINNYSSSFTLQRPRKELISHFLKVNGYSNNNNKSNNNKKNNNFDYDNNLKEDDIVTFALLERTFSTAFSLRILISNLNFEAIFPSIDSLLEAKIKKKAEEEDKEFQKQLEKQKPKNRNDNQQQQEQQQQQQQQQIQQIQKESGKKRSEITESSKTQISVDEVKKKKK